MANHFLKPMTPVMRVAWRAASITFAVGITAFLHQAGFSIGHASPAHLALAVLAFSLASLALRLFFQQADTPEELFSRFLFRRRR